MTVDARGGLWLDNPLLVLGLLSLLWVLLASLHTDPWLRRQRHLRQIGQGLLSRCLWVRAAPEHAGKVGIVRPHLKVAAAGHNLQRVGRRSDAARPTLAQLVAQERKCEAGEARRTASTANTHVGVFPCSIHLLEGFLSDHRLVQQDVVQHRAQ